MKNTKMSEHKRHEENPFLQEAFKKFRQRKVPSKNKPGVELVQLETGENIGKAFLYEDSVVDPEKFIKLYPLNLQKFFRLPKPALGVLEYILKSLKPNEDKLEFNLVKCLRYTEYGHKNAVYKGLAALLDAEFIAKGYSSNIYYINPNVIFNGDRKKLQATEKPVTHPEPFQNLPYGWSEDSEPQSIAMMN